MWTITTFLKSMLCLFMASAVIDPVFAQETQQGTEQEKSPAAPLSAARKLGMVQVLGSELLPAYENKTIIGIYNSYEADVRAGRKPERYTEIHYDNATTHYDHKGRRDYVIKGIYQIKRDQICYTYRSEEYWNGTYCFYVFKRAGCYYHFYEPSGFPTKKSDFDNWTSMAFAKEDEQECLPNIA